MATAPPPQSPLSTMENFLAWLKSRSQKFWIAVIVGAWLLGAVLWMILFPIRIRREEPPNRPATTQVQSKSQAGESSARSKSATVEPGSK